ncbi:unnamed protein product [Closterium sp. NIES-53]
MDGGDLFFSSRPWLSLYGTHVRAVPPVGSVSHGGGGREKETALIHRALPEELLVEVFARLPAQHLGRVACVCRRWRYSIRAPALWKEACFRAWQVCYYRYMCFLPNGKVLYKTSPQVVKDVARQMQAAMHIRFPSSRVLAGGTDASSHAHDGIHLGRYSIVDDLLVGGSAVSVEVSRVSVFVGTGRPLGVVRGGLGRDDHGGRLGRGEGEEEERDPLEVLAELDPEVPAVAHQRGTAAFVFVPFEDADTDILNLPVDKMDFYVPG